MLPTPAPTPSLRSFGGYHQSKNARTWVLDLYAKYHRYPTIWMGFPPCGRAVGLGCAVQIWGSVYLFCASICGMPRCLMRCILFIE